MFFVDELNIRLDEVQPRVARCICRILVRTHVLTRQQEKQIRDAHALSFRILDASALVREQQSVEADSELIVV